MTSAKLEEEIEKAIEKDPRGFEAGLMDGQKEYKQDLWRSYGPGKYGTYADAYVDEWVGNGFADEDIGDVETTNAYSLVRGPFLHPSLKGYEGAILEYTSQGFVNSEFFKTKTALDKKWAKVEKYVEEAESEGDEEAESEDD